MKTKYIGTLIGLIFTLGSFVSIFTIFIPIISVIPGAFFERIAELIVGHDPYSNVGRLVLMTYCILSLILITVFFFHYLNGKKTKKQLKWLFIRFFVISFFLLHGLGFYLFWAFKYNYASDGQLIFIVYESFTYSSISFVILGFLGDMIFHSRKERHITSGHPQCGGGWLAK